MYDIHKDNHGGDANDSIVDVDDKNYDYTGTMVDDDHDPNTYTMIDNNVINIIMMMSAIH